MDLLTPDFGIIFWQTITFLAVLWVLSKFAWKPILQKIQEREEYIETSLRLAAENRKQAEALQYDGDELLKRVSHQADELIQEALVAQRNILKEAEETAAKMKEKMLSEAQQTIAQEKEIAIMQLKGHMALMAIQITEKLLKRELSTKEAQEEMLKALL